MKKEKSKTGPKCPLKRNQVIGLCKRFVKLDQYVFTRDVPVFYKIYKQFPDEKFWRNYELGFTLNALVWFLGKDGQEKIKRDISIFNLDLGERVEYNVGSEKIGEDTEVTSKPKSIADLLR